MFRSAILKVAVFAMMMMAGVDGFVVPSPSQTVSSSSKTTATNDSRRQKQVILGLSPVDLLSDPATAAVSSVASSLMSIADGTAPASDYIPGTSGEVTYSRASYYVILGLYLTSFPGLWSVIKRSTSAKIKRKSYVSDGENAPDGDGKNLREQAGEIMAYMKANNYEVIDAGETITFRGIVQRSTSQAFFLVFCAAVGLASLALVLQIQFQDLVLPGIGEPNWFLLTFLAPYAGIYYWRQGDRVDEVAIKLEANDDETENTIAIQGSEEEIERMWRTLEWSEKGMVKVPGLLEG
mmetsp:Transcript_27349/g.65590  ORF Transcript_27349/g.65590 Transcript_27349/m.65590 type:complete len:294 (+) Transcript_27349:122-1003(+)